MSSDLENSPANTFDNSHIATEEHGDGGRDARSPQSPNNAETDERLDDLFEGGDNSESDNQAHTTSIASMPKIPKRKNPSPKSPDSPASGGKRRIEPETPLNEEEDGDEEGAESAVVIDPKQAEIDELNRQIDAALRSGRKQKRKKTDEDDAAIDESIVELRKRMRDAAYRDIDDNKDRLPAIHKLSMLQDVVDELSKTQLYEAFLDNNIVDSIRLWLEPLDDGSLPSLDIQNAMLDVLKKLPIRRDHLRESGIGKIILFMSRCSRIPERNRRLCEQFVQQWSRMVLRLSADFRDRKIKEASVDLTRRKLGAPRVAAAAVEALQRRVPGGIRVESGRDGERTTARIPQRVAADYTVMPVSSLSVSSTQPQSNRNLGQRFKRMKQAMNRSGR
ncbi:Transcription factor iws1 [Coemansia sp. RSA 1722]|nr:Transcription factor iws1 [Coemansia sp. RSA 485]KAJ2586845.1 Transcription factor iws1 [Coemansia sp. RSA 1722]KAJ2635173.1 Transcription factor iws1 [Coemansia sp. RSA 1286]